MTTKHTPGSWTYTRDAWTDEHPFSVAVGSRIICDVSVFTGHDEANARLIAAAPELLDALHALANTADHADADFAEYKIALRMAVRQARAAIAKARGED